MVGEGGLGGTGAFAGARECFEAVVGFLQREEASALDHAQLETRLKTQGRELLRRLYQDHLQLRAERERRLDQVVDAEGVPRGAVEAGHPRGLHTIFGEVEVTRLAYRRRGHANLHPADATLNLPEERHSHGLRRVAAIEASRGSFDEAVEAIEASTGQHVGKRQAEELTTRAAADFDTFYEDPRVPGGEPDEVLVVSVDGKGIVMRPDALRKATAEAAAKATSKLATRLSKGEKRGRKRMAELGAVYEVTPVPRSPGDVLPGPGDEERLPTPAPTAKSKWLTASVVEDAATVVSQVFDEAERRDPGHERTWVALVDGNNHQITRIQAEARARGVGVSVVVDFVHVLEYLWKAAWSFFDEGDPAAESWVRDKALGVLCGGATRVAGAIRRTATNRGLGGPQRAGADTCAEYLTRKASFLDYPTALKRGWPIATGVIEGACRHLVKDRMDITGARWGLEGAEAVLKLRALRSNGDFEDYWRYHLSRERQRVHESRYAGNVLPRAA